MPIACEPWPGNRNAMLVTTSLPPHESCALREASPERDDEHEVAALEPAGGDRCLERDVDRGGAGVAVMIDVDEHAVHRQVRALVGGLDDPEIGLVRDEQADDVRGEPVALEDALGA